MLFLLASWAILLAFAVPVGLAVLRWIGAERVLRVADRLIVAGWVGLIVLGSALLALSLFTRISPLAGLALGLAAAIPALSLTAVRADLREARTRLTPPLLLGGGAFALGVAIVCSQPVVLFDMGQYHAPSIRWLSDFGAVPGVGLLHGRFGFGSSWFALAAPFSDGGLREHSGAVLGGLGFLLFGAHVTLCVSRAVARRAGQADWMLIAGALLILPVIAISQKLEVSTSPDLPLNVLILLAGWAIVAIEARGLADGEPRSRLSPGLTVLPLVLAAGAMAIKPLAGPAVLVTAIYYLARSPSSRRAVAWTAGVGAAVLGPWIAFELVTTGCPAFPLPLCFDLPWSVGSGSASAAVDLVEGSRYRGEAPSGGLGWFDSWLTDDFKRWVVALGVAAVVLAAATVVARRAAWRRVAGWLLALALAVGYVFFIRAEELTMVVLTVVSVASLRLGGSLARWLLALGLAGMALILLQAPDPRFALGYLGVLLGRFAIVGRERLLAAFESWLPRLRTGWRPGLAVLLAGAGVTCAVLPLARPTTTRGDVVERFGLVKPPPMPAAVVFPRLVNGIAYKLPPDGECWTIAPVCAPQEPDTSVFMRDPAAGFAAGFERR